MPIIRNSENKIKLSGIPLKKKVAQMIIANGNNYQEKLLELGIGGIFISKQKSKKSYEEIISKYQKESKIKLFVTADMEGYWNPFSIFYKSKNIAEISNKEEAYELGKEHGKILKEMGFNLNFAPVVEVRNNVWTGRSFLGDKKEVKEKIKNYIKGLHEEKIMATAKHYPGGSMIKDPHLFRFKTEIFSEDLEYFDYAIKNKVDAIMIGHPTVYGAIDSKGKQSTISSEVINTLKNFDGLIIADAITMLGLRLSYLFNFNSIYVDLIKAGNDLIIDSPIWMAPFSSTPKRIKKRIDAVVKAVKKGEIGEARINESVKKILKAKGYHVFT